MNDSQSVFLLPAFSYSFLRGRAFLSDRNILRDTCLNRLLFIENGAAAREIAAAALYINYRRPAFIELY